MGGHRRTCSGRSGGTDCENFGTKATQLFANREAFDNAVDAKHTEKFRTPVAEEDTLEDGAALEPYPEHLGATTPNDR